MNYVELKGTAQGGMKEEDLEKCDFLSGIIGIPIFSERFVEKSDEKTMKFVWDGNTILYEYFS